MAYIYNFTDTWTNGATTYTGIGLDVTNTASSVSSQLINLKVAGASQFSVDASGGVRGVRFYPSLSSSNNYIDDGETANAIGFVHGGARKAALANNLSTFNTALPNIGGFTYTGWQNGGVLAFSGPSAGDGNSNRAADSVHFYSGAGTGNGSASNMAWFLGSTGASGGQLNPYVRGTELALLAGLPQYRVYNAYTDSANYERLNIGWGSNVLTIGTQAAGTGTKRNIVIDSANRSAYIASPTAAEIRDIFISFGLMAAS